MADANIVHDLIGTPRLTEVDLDALPAVQDRLAALLERGLGLSPTQHALGAFIQQTKARAHSLGIEETAYLRLLEMGGPAARTEWMAVAPALVVGETFLFRDTQLWNLIENTILPGIASCAHPLWMWSAGCSTGEEAYTLAIVARRALGNKARILATDVNPKAVAAARVGVYSQWSLRGVEADRREGLTVNGTQTVRVHEDVKSMVRFETHNLNDDTAYPPFGMQSFELIVCRNVLIYMSHPSRAKVINSLASLVSPGGVLILGHGEAAGIEVGDLEVERHEAGVVYRRPLHPVVRAVHAVPAPKAPARRSASPKRKINGRASSTATNRGSTATHSGRASSTATNRGSTTTNRGSTATSTSKTKYQEFVASAIQHARSGKLDVAERSALAAIGADSLEPEPHVLLAALMMARGALREAETELRRALFLDPVFVPALWQIGNLYGITERKRQAAYAFARALTQLEGLSPDTEALPFDNLTVGELSTLLRAELGERSEA